ncbi:TetR family transcriptional regulator [Mycolicibacterium sp. HK-90]|uniref:TetR family transcriptional regulator n=1 Tax=Mycolicibacterium sp. HK-90 TaxID=3056937 RepID=UPI00265A180F|nr:TetR family transcriptional regulator [Mycolicibacterium sp. HK-90]WKG05917.1 TetR family transcriptional regulator [Mycolicibacterium sp. HK-90]
MRQTNLLPDERDHARSTTGIAPTVLAVSTPELRAATTPLPLHEARVGAVRLTSNRIARRDRIVDAAMSLAAQGYDSCHIRSVATAAGVAAATVYQYFPSKDDLLLACFHEWLWDFETEFRCDTNDPDPFRRLLQVSLTLTDSLSASPRFAESMIRPYLYADGTAAAQADMVRRQLVRIFIGSLGEHELNPRQIGAAEILSDVWMTNIAAFTQQRIPLEDLTQRLARTVALLKG